MTIKTIFSIAGSLVACFFSAAVSMAQIPDPTLITLNTGRQFGVFTKEDAIQKAAVIKGSTPSTTALLVFRGWPGIARLESGRDAFRSLNFMQGQIQLFTSNGVSLVVVDCPTDQWALRNPGNPASCDDNFRSSESHAADIRKLIATLRNEHGFTSIFLFGHSYGTISSKWLAFHLGDMISGSIHSAAQTLAGRGDYAQFGNSSSRIKLDQVRTPIGHIHHADDRCWVTPYAIVKDYAGKNLMSVYGGSTSGDQCGAKHYHSYEGREAAVSKAIIRWIKTGELEETIGRD